MNLNLKARLVAAVAVFKANQDIRYYLNGVYVEPAPEGGAIIAATNGHAMCVWRDTTATGVDRPIILATDAKLLQACQGSDLKRLVVRDGRLAVVLNKEGPGVDLQEEVYIQPIGYRKTVGCAPWEIEGKFPDWVQVIPNAPAHGVKGLFNAEYLAMVGRAMKIGNTLASKFFAPQLNQDNQDSAILVSWNADKDFLAVIMPMREDPFPFPDWMATRKAEWETKQAEKAKMDAENKVSAQATAAAICHTSEDPHYKDAVAIVLEQKKPSISLVQRHLQIGYNRAARLLEEMAKNGVIKQSGTGYEMAESPAP